MKENQTTVKEYKLDKPVIQKKDSINDVFIRDCHVKLFHTFEYRCIYVIKFATNRDNEKVNLTIGDKGMGLSDLNEKKKCFTKWFYN